MRSEKNSEVTKKTETGNVDKKSGARSRRKNERKDQR